MMRKPKTEAVVRLPSEEALQLALLAAQEGVPTPDYLGIQVLRGAYGASHPDVIAHDTRDKVGRNGTTVGEDT